MFKSLPIKCIEELIERIFNEKGVRKRFAFVLIMFFSLIGKSQGVVDTLVIFDPLIPSPWISKTSPEWNKASQRYYDTRVKPIMDSLRSRSENDEAIAYTNQYYEYPRNRKFYIKYFAEDSLLAYEGLRYNQYYIGLYKSYHRNGQPKSVGIYTDFVYRKNGMIKRYPSKDGEWIYYSKSGKIIRTEHYKMGRKVK